MLRAAGPDGVAHRHARPAARRRALARPRGDRRRSPDSARPAARRAPRRARRDAAQLAETQAVAAGSPASTRGCTRTTGASASASSPPSSTRASPPKAVARGHARRPQHGRRRRAGRRSGRSAATRITRVVQLGAPNQGSFAPVLALRGVYPTVRKLAALDRRHERRGSRAHRLSHVAVAARAAARPAARRRQRTSSIRRTGRATRCGPNATLLSGQPRNGQRWPAIDDALPARRRRAPGHGDARDLATARNSSTPSRATATARCRCRLPRAPANVRGTSREKHGGLPNNGRVIAAVVDLLRTGDHAPAADR